MRNIVLASLLALLALTSCTSSASDPLASPPSLEDVLARVTMTQEAAFDALLAHARAEPSTTVDEVDRPRAFRTRRGTAPEVSYRVEPFDGRTLVTVRRNPRTTTLTGVQQELQLVYGSSLHPQLWQRYVDTEPAADETGSTGSAWTAPELARHTCVATTGRTGPTFGRTPGGSSPAALRAGTRLLPFPQACALGAASYA